MNEETIHLFIKFGHPAGLFCLYPAGAFTLQRSVLRKPEDKKQNIMLLLANLVGSLGGISMILSAVFPISMASVHSVFSAALYILIGTGFVFTVVSLLYYPKFPRWMFALGILVGIVDMLWAMVLNVYLMEFVTVGLLLVFTLLLGLHTRVRENFC